MHICIKNLVVDTSEDDNMSFQFAVIANCQKSVENNFLYLTQKTLDMHEVEVLQIIGLEGQKH